MRKDIKITISLLATILVLSLLLTLATLILTPKNNSPLERGIIGEYYDETDAGNTHQVVFVGDCEVYESFVPPVLYEEYGITSYIRGSAQQLIWQSYYLLEETFKYESPDVVVFNVLSMKYGEPQREEYNRMTLDPMRNSSIKYNAIKASMTDEESLLSYYFPLLRYHSRWKEITPDDFKYMFGTDNVTHNGYLMQTAINPKTDTLEGRPLKDYTLPEISFEYLNKMKALCDANGAELILIKAPTNVRAYWWYDEWDEQIVSFANANDVAYYNFIDNEEIGIDWSCDTYDMGMHLNVYGAEKMTVYFGKLLTERHGIESMKNNPSVSNIWNEKYTNYIAHKNELIGK